MHLHSKIIIFALGKVACWLSLFRFSTSQIKTTRLQNCTICLKKACKMTQITRQNDSFHPTKWTISELRMTHIEPFLDRNRQAKAKIWKTRMTNIVWYFEFFLKRCLFIFLFKTVTDRPYSPLHHHDGFPLSCTSILLFSFPKALVF